MSKKIIPEDIDENALLASIYAKKNPGIDTSEQDLPKKDNEPFTVNEPSTKRKKISKGSYSEEFLGRKEKNTKRPSVYIDLELHNIISEIVKVIAVKMTVGEYIDMVLWEHLKQNKDEINKLYRQDRDDLIKIE
ncbi:hypothetical protein M2451_002904 [Dysgonomonas sp. PFB1-18]|uniref:DUF3408 domain-containing protein n=1 Tax=unclassified Dysgonomonas TaxID=2630389 RepID=UPI0013D3F4E3|nr:MULTISPECIES: DUF3408 domain-containing protein [unclassified Dysgonomonas]MDH6310014.1 hypothetical protein [Dysgonomonas sp. PF1-14]MDH6339923.1 hypothetical protein [Dysgonomonas sp. PF1-16]MDH6381571.1 hypothetical protein [Dysgonomonas sp. PFB1-18]MDH6398792.1 hypothetical protein [Dysgonomonas sp. PF1-23]NDV93636.1 DUF3408 domain-containing protein [Dysgonomonas sp. 521]